MRLFDAYLAIDWSSRNKPSPHKETEGALWIGEAALDGSGIMTIGAKYERTRKSCIKYIRERLLHHAERNHRVFVGFDFAYGYPRGYATALGFKTNGQPWRYIWDQFAKLIEDDDENKNNRFEVASKLNTHSNGTIPGPMWGCPVGKLFPNLSPTSPKFPFTTKAGIEIESLRLTDRQNSGVQPVWKLFGAGSVGGQSLVGIPCVRNLRDDPALSPFSRVWPFETRFTPNPTPSKGPFVLHAEIWPGVLGKSLQQDMIRDQAQVKGMVKWLNKLDSQGELGSLFALPSKLSSEEIRTCEQEEGWILGAGLKNQDN